MSFFLFPGQGSQTCGMGRDFYEASAAARDVFEQAAQLVPDGFLESIFTSDQETLNQTRIAQPALLTVEVAIAMHLSSLGIRPAGCAGHSLGEIPALVVAGACAFEDAVRFTLERARLMSEDVPEGGMAAILGLDSAAVEAALPEGVQIANYNGPGQTIISGTNAAIEKAGAVLKEAGAKRVMPLKVSGPFHSELMRHAAEEFAKVLSAVPFRAPHVRFISSVAGGEVGDPEEIRRLLSRQLVRPVRWTQVMEGLDGVEALEVGPGSILKGLAKRAGAAPRVAKAGTLEEVEAYAVSLANG